MDDFAAAMDNIPKIVFSNTLNKLDWHSADLTNKTIEHLVSELKSQSGKDILVGSRSLIIQLIKLNLIDQRVTTATANKISNNRSYGITGHTDDKKKKKYCLIAVDKTY